MRTPASNRFGDAAPTSERRRTSRPRRPTRVRPAPVGIRQQPDRARPRGRRRRARRRARPVRPCSTTDGDAAGRRRHQRRARRQRLHHDVRQAVDVAASSRTEGTTATSARGEVLRRPRPASSTPGKRTRSATPRARARARSSASRSPSPAMTRRSVGHRGASAPDGVDQVLEALLADEAAGREQQRVVRRRRPARARPSARALGVGPEALARRRRRARSRPVADRAPSAIARSRRSSLHAVIQSRAAERGLRGDARRTACRSAT